MIQFLFFHLYFVRDEHLCRGESLSTGELQIDKNMYLANGTPNFLSAEIIQN